MIVFQSFKLQHQRRSGTADIQRDAFHHGVFQLYQGPVIDEWNTLSLGLQVRFHATAPLGIASTNISKHTKPIAMKYTAFVALVVILPAASAMAVDSPLGKSMSDSPLGKSVCAAAACPCHGAPNAAFCGDGLSNCIHGHLYQCANDGKSSCDLADSCPQAAGLN
ncbi:hypothetical protein JB92DRAFT_2837081 [Gautieria morchelliformis]|nr:hypothetical protein JB92DRAFT_2837081 [Gautieria morchelliformis]